MGRVGPGYALCAKVGRKIMTAIASSAAKLFARKATPVVCCLELEIFVLLVKPKIHLDPVSRALGE